VGCALVNMTGLGLPELSFSISFEYSNHVLS